MSVRKPLQKQKKESVDIDALIDKGARVKEDEQSDKKKWTNINVRISVEMLNNLDLLVRKRVGITRTGLILEAIDEKLKENR